MVKIDQQKCLGCGTCVGICPEVFEMGADGKAQVKAGADLAQYQDKIADAIDACPTQAILE